MQGGQVAGDKGASSVFTATAAVGAGTIPVSRSALGKVGVSCPLLSTLVAFDFVQDAIRLGPLGLFLGFEGRLLDEKTISVIGRYSAGSTRHCTHV